MTPFQVDLAGGPIEAGWVGPRPPQAPTIILLHEGLGALSLWRDFPMRLAQATGYGVLAYSRYGYGGSAPAPLPRPLGYMHHEALEVLPALIAALGIGEHVLYGHSDGGSIALIHAGGAPRPGLRGLAVAAPHVLVEAMNIERIRRLGEEYRTTDLAARLRRHHGGDDAFWGWQRAWVSPAFADWNIEAYLPRIAVPVLALQGAADEFGSLRHLSAILSQVAGSAEAVKLMACGHSPHRDQPEAVLAHVARFIAALKPKD